MAVCLSLASVKSIVRRRECGRSLRSVGAATLLFAALNAPALGAADVIALPKNADVVAEGDSLTYGLDATPGVNMPPINGSGQPRSRAPYPETLATMLRQCRVTNHGYPGDRSVDGLVRWQNAKPATLSLLMYGSNDALNNGHASSGVVSVKTFTEVLSLMISSRRSEGSKIVIMLPPPIKDPHADRLIEGYRQAARKVANQQSLPVIDIPAVLKGVDPIWTEDRVHLSEKANIRIAEYLSQHIRCE